MKVKNILFAFAFGLILIASATFASAAYAYTTNWLYQGNPVSSVRAVTFTCNDAGCNSLGTRISDISSSTNSVTISYPIPSPTYGYATYWFSPGFIYQEMNWTPQTNGAYTGTYSFTKKSSCQANIASFNVPSSINEGSQVGITSSVSSALHEANVAPYGEPSDSDIVSTYFSAQTNVSLTIKNTLTNQVVYSSTQSGNILWDSNSAFNFAWTPDYAQSGNYLVTLTTNVPDNKCASSSAASQSMTLAVNNVNRNPVLNAIGDKSVNEGSLLQFTISATDIDGDILTYSASNLPSGATFNPSTRTFAWTPDYAQSGSYQVTFSVSDGVGGSDSEMINIDVNDVSIPGGDSVAPQYSNLASTPSSPATYASGQNYTLNATWTDNVLVDDVWIVFNGTSYLAYYVGGSGYSITFSDLAAGSYSYQWFANDSSGNTASTGVLIYTIDKAVPGLSLVISPSSSIENGTETNVTGAGCPSQLSCTLYRDGTAVSNPDVAILGTGNYNYVYNTTGNENYTAYNVSASLEITSQVGETEGKSGDIIELTDSELSGGKTLNMEINDRIKFNFCKAPYYIKLTEIDEDDERAYFAMTPGTMTFILEEGESEQLDLNADGIKDVLFRLERVVSSDKVKVYVKRLSEKCAAAPLKETLSVYGGQTGAIEGKKTSLGFVLPLMLGMSVLGLIMLLYLMAKLGRKQKKRILSPVPLPHSKLKPLNNSFDSRGQLKGKSGELEFRAL